MRYMMLVKATKDFEAGVWPDEKMLSEMAKYNEELVKAVALLACQRLQPSSQGVRVPFRQREVRCDRRALRRDQGADRRHLSDPGEVQGRSHPVGQATSRSRKGRSRFARCSN